jgi:hypothetical protein
LAFFSSSGLILYDFFFAKLFIFSFLFQAVFSVKNCHTDVFLVIRIETILQGSLTTTSEPYIKPNPDLKTSIKAQKSAKSYCSR